MTGEIRKTVLLLRFSVPPSLPTTVTLGYLDSGDMCLQKNIPVWDLSKGVGRARSPLLDPRPKIPRASGWMLGGVRAVAELNCLECWNDSK